jgi:hypothetical protein
MVIYPEARSSWLDADFVPSHVSKGAKPFDKLMAGYEALASGQIHRRSITFKTEYDGYSEKALRSWLYGRGSKARG